MEYAKDILIGLKQGQAENNRKEKKKQGFISRCLNHKFILTIVLAIVSFIVLDLILISNFISVLITI